MLILFDGLYYWDGIGLKLSPVGCCHSFLFGLSREYWTGDNRKQKREQNQESSVRYHQWFNEESGHPKLKEHIAGVMALMRVSYDWPDFMSKVDMAFPVRTNQGALFSRSSDKKGDKHS